MRKGQRVVIKLDGNKYSAIYLGKGLFSKAYIVQTSNGPYVLLYSTDYIKEVLALYADKSNPHVPKIWRYDTNIYLMPYYRPLTLKYRVAWKEYRTLEKLWKRAKYKSIIGYQAIEEFISLCKLSPHISKNIVAALQEIYDVSLNYGQDILFEIAPRNLGVNNNGQLILRDICFVIGQKK